MAKKEKKKSNFSLRRLIYNDKYLIIVSLILAVVIWIVASINIGTDENRTIKMNVPITLGDEISEQYGMQYYSIQDNIELNVTISGPKYVIGQVKESDLSVNFDSSSVNRTGAQTIPILVTNNSRTLDFEITNTYPSTIDAFFDVNATKSFNVDVEYDESNIAAGYVFGNPIVSESSVLVSGPKTFIDDIKSIYTEVDFNGDNNLNEAYNAECELQIKGLGAESSYLSITTKEDTEHEISNVSVTLPVLKEALLPVSVDIEGQPLNVGNGVSIQYSVDQLNVGVLAGANIKEAVVGKLDYKQLTVGQNVFEFDVSNIKGITVLDDIKTVYVYVYVAESYSSHVIDASSSNIKIEGVPQNKTAKIIGLDNTDITVIAPKRAVLNADSLEITVDVSKKRKNNIYPASFVVKTNNNAWVYGDYNVEVELN